MPEKFTITEIPSSKQEVIEQLGTKRKFWFTDDTNASSTLFKEGRPGTGENWVEVIVSEICDLLDIPHAKYHFATSEDDYGRDISGTITPTFVPYGARLILGNELLSRILPESIEYDSSKKYGLKEYNLRTVLALFKSGLINIPLGYNSGDIQSSLDVFVGYILLDCLISNPDRHHENWGIILQDKILYLTPTYDHASGLGCRESDEKKVARLTTHDKNFTVESFVKKAKTPFYDKGKKLSTIEACRLCSKLNKKASLYWLDKIQNMDLEKIKEVLNRVPDDLISEASKNFALQVLAENRKRLMTIKEDLENE